MLLWVVELLSIDRCCARLPWGDTAAYYDVGGDLFSTPIFYPMFSLALLLEKRNKKSEKKSEQNSDQPCTENRTENRTENLTKNQTAYRRHKTTQNTSVVSPSWPCKTSVALFWGALVCDIQARSPRPPPPHLNVALPASRAPRAEQQAQGQP